MNETWEEYREFKIENNSGEKLFVAVRLKKSRSLWGADADGRRGVTRTCVEEYKIECIYDLESGKEVTEKYDDDPDVLKEIEKQL